MWETIHQICVVIVGIEIVALAAIVVISIRAMAKVSA